MKLSKPELKLQKEVFQLIENNNTFTFEQLEYIYENFNPGYISDVITHSAYFTPLDMAYDFAKLSVRHGVIVDMCAGIGCLSFAVKTRDTYEHNITQQICIERNHKYINIGKKLLPTAQWIQGDIFDKSIWDSIIDQYGKIDCIISNPPFGKMSKSDSNRDWLKYTGVEIDIASIEVALKYTDNVSMILPINSCTFSYSGMPYYQERENKKIEKLKQETGLSFIMCNPGIDTTAYSQFKNTKITVEHVDFITDDF